MIKKFALTGLLAIAAAFSNAETYALCIGINDYEGEKNDLKGAVNDANKFKDVFITSYGVKAANVRMLLDKNVSLDKFLAEMKWLISSAKAGDQIAFMYSGHGGQVDDKTEADGKEEVLVLADGNLIPGDLFGELAKALNEARINSTWIFDSCFSGGMSRDPQERDKNIRNIKPKSANAILDATLKFKQIKPKAMANDQEPASAAFLFASQEGKPSKDISGLEGIPAHGLFTLLLTSVLADSPQATIKDLYGLVNATLEALNKKLKEQGADKSFDQGPNFETTASRAAFGILLP